MDKKDQQAGKNKSVSAVPTGYHTVTPYLIVNEAAKLIEFIEDAFDGESTFTTYTDDGKIMHATVTIGDSTIMISDTMEDNKTQTAMLYLYLENVDDVYKRAIEAKATSVREPVTEFYGDRAGAVKDASGNVWWIATHVEDVAEDELERRSKKALEERKKKGTEQHV